MSGMSEGSGRASGKGRCPCFFVVGHERRILATSQKQFALSI